MKPMTDDEHAFVAGLFALDFGNARSNLSLQEIAEIMMEKLAPEETEALVRALTRKDR
jgi:hypothetical protein